VSLRSIARWLSLKFSMFSLDGRTQMPCLTARVFTPSNLSGTATCEIPDMGLVYGLDECHHHHMVVHDGGCDACGGLHSMAHGYATVRVNSQSDALYCPGYSRGCAPSFDRSYFERIATPLSANTVYICSSSCGNNAPHSHSEMCHMWRLTLVIFRGSNGSVSSRQCRVSRVSRGP
jgi:hypothetical protein